MKVLQSMSLPTHIAARSPLAWSAKGSLAVATTKGLLIYDLFSNPTSEEPRLGLDPSMLAYTTECNPYLQEVEIDPDVLLEQLPVSEQFRVIDLFMCAKPEPAKSMERQANVIDWSPDDRLLVVTDDHWLRAYTKVSHGQPWMLSHDLSNELRKYLRSRNWRDCAFTAGDSEGGSKLPKKVLKATNDLTGRVRAQCFTDVAWCLSEEDDGGDHILITASKLGHVIVWRWHSDGRAPTVDCVQQITDVPIVKLATHRRRPADFLVFAAAADGRIWLRSLRWVGQVKDVVLEDWGCLRDRADRRLAGALKVLDSAEKDGRCLRLAMGLARHLVVADVKIDDEARTATVANKRATLCHSTVLTIEHLRTNKDVTSLVVVCETGPMLALRVGPTWKDDLAFELQTMTPPDGLDVVHYRCLGLQSSPNGSLLAVTQNVCAYHDHLILKNPSRLVFVTPTNGVKDLIYEVLGEAIDSPASIPDHLEVMRLMNKADEATTAVLLDKIRRALSLGGKPKLCLWLTQHLIQALEEEDEENSVLEELKGAHNDLVGHILLRQAEQALKDKDLCASAQWYLSQRRPSAATKKHDGRQYEWQCRLCDSSAQQVAVDHVVCANGHVWPLCVRSLAVCDRADSVHCVACGATALPPVDMCTLCDGLMSPKALGT
jgi:hypothetical protein